MFIKNYDKVAMIENGEEISYSDLLRAVDNYSSYYKKIKPGARIAIVAENRSEWFYAFLACWRIQATPVPIDALSTEEEIAYILQDCKPEYIVFTETTKDICRKSLKKVKKKIKPINIDTIRFNPDKYDPEPLPELNANDTAVIIYTSGTTGNPKGVMLSYDNIMANIESVSCKESLFYTAETRIIVLLPLHHSFPLMGCFLAPLHVGGTCIFCPSLTGEDIMATLQNYGITLFLGVPRLYDMIIKAIRNKINASGASKAVFKIAGLIGSKKLSRVVFKSVQNKFGGHIEGLISGGAALDYHTARDFSTLGFDVMEGYGMTETAPMISCPRPGKVKVGNVGLPITNTEVKIIENEVCCRGRNVMKGYYNRPEETTQVIRDGWLHTGDKGFFDRKGYLHINGRIKEIIILSNGKNVNPVEIEQKLEKNSDIIKEAAVIDDSDLLTAVINPDSEFLQKQGILNIEEYIKQEVIDPYNRSASPYKRIKKIILTSTDFPRTRLGKIQRFKLERTTAPVKASKEKSKSSTKESTILMDYILRETGRKVKVTDHIEIDVGLDSLDKLSLLTFIQAHFNMDANEELLSKYPTIQAIADYISKNRGSGVVEVESSDPGELPKSRFPHITLRNLMCLPLRMLSRITITGQENIPVAPYIMCANHQSAFDWLFIAHSMHKSILRKSYIFAKTKHFKSRLRKGLAARSNIILLDINKDLNTSIEQMQNVLQKGSNLVLFPEGTRSKDGSLLEFKKTFALLAKEINVPVLPIAIDGARHVLPKSALFIRPFKKVGIHYLPPVYPSGKTVEEIVALTQSSIDDSLKK
ncbi:MAG: AMP-binding protein [Spirochaetes bacterium]|nr:AMP-binding protein [Spirochaetota bacterium]